MVEPGSLEPVMLVRIQLPQPKTKGIKMSKPSIVWEISQEKLEELVNNSSSIAELLRKVGLENIGGNYKTIKNCLIKRGINFDHIKLGLGSNKGRKFNSSITKTPYEKVFNNNSTVTQAVLKRRVLSDHVIPYKCSECGLSDQWNGKQLILALDHINGNNHDNRIENLRFLCPNCHSQTDTFAGKGLKSKELYCKCGRRKAKNQTMCFTCLHKEFYEDPKSFKENHPSATICKTDINKDELIKLLNEGKSFCEIGKLHNVTDNAVRRWCKKLGIYNLNQYSQKRSKKSVWFEDCGDV